MSEDGKVVALRPYDDLPDKSNPAVPDHIWLKFQELGALATEKLAALLNDERFSNFSVKDQMRIIETTFQRAYGSPDGSVRRHLHLHEGDPEAVKGFNVLRDLSHKAKHRLPEFRSPHRGETIDVEPVARRPLPDVESDD